MIKHKIGRFEVTMDDLFLMEISHSLEKLMENIPHKPLRGIKVRAEPRVEEQRSADVSISHCHVISHLPRMHTHSLVLVM